MVHVLETGLEFLQANNPNGKPSVRGFNIINGQLANASDGESFQSTNPALLADCLGEFPLSTRDDVHAALKAARAAFPAWSATPAPTRGQIIGNMGRLLMEHKDDLVALETREIGKTLKESGGEIQEAIDTCLFFQSEGRRLYGQTVNSELPDKELFTYRRALGVCGIINACNFPSAVPFWKMIPAIMCGNTCVWKSPQDAPLLSFALARIMHQAGLPDGVINLVHGKGSGAGQYLVDAVDEGLVQRPRGLHPREPGAVAVDPQPLAHDSGEARGARAAPPHRRRLRLSQRLSARATPPGAQATRSRRWVSCSGTM